MPEIKEIRHSLSHLMTMAVLELYPQAKLGVGPVIEDGFYQDYDLPEKITDKILPKLQSRMKKLIAQKINFIQSDISISDALEFYKQDPYKTELINELKEKGNKKVNFFDSGFLHNLCAGPHVNNTKEINIDAFKLTKIAGAYWRGSEKNKMLTRIYGIAFGTKKELDDYLKMLIEAEKRDHRKLGKELELFMTSEEVGQGLISYLPNGAFIRRHLEDYIAQKERNYGYKMVITPVLMKGSAYEKSGHLAHYRDSMYNPIDIEGEDYYLKPMNCPHHHYIYKNDLKSYRELPLRLAEFGLCHRYERSGVLSGLIRARNFTQNDSHIYCALNQAKSEFISVLNLFKEVYTEFGIKDYWFRLSLPDYNNKEKYGNIENRDLWEKSSDLIRKALNEHGDKYIEVEGEAAFYGPKVDVQIKNVFGKEDSIATCQLDFYSPERFDLSFINETGKKERPVIIHRAIMGSFERFMAFLIEQTAGNFPVWLSPVQIALLPVSEKHNDYCLKLANELKDFRVEIDQSAETVGNKIRKVMVKKIPYVLVIGDKEMNSENLMVRYRGEKEARTIAKKIFIENILEKIKTRSLEL